MTEHLSAPPMKGHWDGWDAALSLLHSGVCCLQTSHAVCAVGAGDGAECMGWRRSLSCIPTTAGIPESFQLLAGSLMVMGCAGVGHQRGLFALLSVS